MYLEGLGFRAISRILKISYGTVYVWVREWGSKVSLPRKEAPIPIVELDEMHTYISQKKTAVRYGLLLIDLENGTSILSVETGQQQQE
jgi:transposase